MGVTEELSLMVGVFEGVLLAVTEGVGVFEGAISNLKKKVKKLTTSREEEVV